jgi:hypothetical protein
VGKILFSDPYVCTIVITHAICSINIVYTRNLDYYVKKIYAAILIHDPIPYCFTNVPLLTQIKLPICKQS